MIYKNSFFKITVTDGNTFLDLYPPMNGGQQLNLQEVVSFLDGKCLSYDIEAVKSGISGLTNKPIRVKISSSECEPFDESAVVTVAADKMTAYIRFYPPSTGGNSMTKKEILNEISRMNIKYGIQDRVIDVFLSAKQYCLDIPMVRGKKPVLPVAASVEYFFETKPLAKPKVLDDGGVDFHSLNLFIKVNKGDVLAVLTPAVEGTPGKNIYGDDIPVKKAKTAYIKYGKNLQLSDDKLTLTSMVDGNVSLIEGTVFVSDTYNVAADVDASTGDIEYDGNILVAGNVRTGFNIKAKGDIQINGVVEGASVEAGGNIVIKRGMQGMGKGVLKAGNDVCAQFIESSEVVAGGNVTSGSILHSKIQSGNMISVMGKKGFIVGGETCCESFVEVNTIGNKMETQTLLKIGVKPELFEEIKSLVTAVTPINEKIEEVTSYLNVYKTKMAKGLKLTPENIKSIKEYNNQLIELQHERESFNDRLQTIKEILEQSKDGFVKCHEKTFPAVTIMIGKYSFAIKEPFVRSLFKIQDGEIKATSF